MAVRKCSFCGEPMSVGFIIHDGEEYYCSEECLHKVYTEAEYLDMYAEDEAFYTDWVDEDEEEEEKPATLRVCFKAPGQPVQVREINNSVSALQGLVGGYFEVAKFLQKGVAVLCDEDGLYKHRRYNCLGLVGPLVFLGVGPTDFRSLTDEEVVSIMEREEFTSAIR